MVPHKSPFHAVRQDCFTFPLFAVLVCPRHTCPDRCAFHGLIQHGQHLRHRPEDSLQVLGVPHAPRAQLALQKKSASQASTAWLLAHVSWYCGSYSKQMTFVPDMPPSSQAIAEQAWEMWTTSKRRVEETADHKQSYTPKGQAHQPHDLAFLFCTFGSETSELLEKLLGWLRAVVRYPELFEKK